MNDALRAAVETLTDRVKAKQSELTQLKQTVNMLCREAGLEPMYALEQDDDPGLSTRPDLYYGKPFSTAARDLLTRRKSALSGEDIMRGLEGGGFDFEAQGWKAEGRLRAVAASLAKNTAIFHRIPTGQFGLKEWYPAAIERKGKNRAGGSNEHESAEDEEASADDEKP